MKTSRSRLLRLLSFLFVPLLLLSAAPAWAQTTGFGGAVAAGAEAVFVGQSENRYGPGLVYVYRKNAEGAWTEAAQLEASGGAMHDRFGRAVAVADGLLLVGATPPQEGEAGRAYAFTEGTDGTWSEVGHFSADDAGAESGFGSEIALSGDLAFVSAPAQDSARGAVYVFERTADGTWTQQTELTGSAIEPGALFGASVSAAGDWLFVGAPGRWGRQGPATSGAVYVFHRTEDGWTETTVLTDGETEQQSQFGVTVARQDSLLLVGGPRYGETGSVFVFQQRERGWQKTGQLLPFDGDENAFFGASVAFSEDGVWVGAPGTEQYVGRIYRFERDADGQWTTAAKLAAEPLTTRAFFGQAMDVQGGVAVVGATLSEGGTAAIFEPAAEGNWALQTLVRGQVDALPAVSGERVRCTDGEASLYDCSDVALLSFLPIHQLGGEAGVNLNDIWGWTDPQTGKEYALVGRTNGAAFVDISDPANPVYVGELPMTEGAQASSWRDIKTYEHHAYIVSDNAGEHGMQVFDLTKLRQYEGEPITFEPELVYDEINSAHNLFINDETGFAYVVGSGGGGTTCGGGLHMVNIQDPLNPQFAGCFADESTGRRGTGYSHDVQCVVYQGPDDDYQGSEICFGSNETALSIADVTDKENPAALAAVPYPNVSYAHQGWLTADHRYFFSNDELDELSGKVEQTRTLIWDVSDLDDPQLIAQYTYGTTSSDHNLYITDGLMYQSNYASGLRIHDVTDPENPEQVAFFDTTPVGSDGAGFTGTWSNYPFYESGVIAVSSIGEGLFLLRYQQEQAL